MPVAMVTGASRGVGRGVATSLAAEGFDVFATGRTIQQADLPPAVRRIRCDHLIDAETARAFDELRSAGGGLDILVNSAWGGYERIMDTGEFRWSLPFWEQPLARWTSMMDAGVRAAYACSAQAAKMMVPHGRGLIVNISYWAARKYMGNVMYGVAKAATDKMTGDMAEELRPHGVTAVSLYPGLVRTELVLSSGWFDLSNSESPEFIGRVIAAMWRDAGLADRSGRALVAAQVALELGVVDVDGKQPKPLSLETA